MLSFRVLILGLLFGGMGKTDEILIFFIPPVTDITLFPTLVT